MENKGLRSMAFACLELYTQVLKRSKQVRRRLPCGVCIIFSPCVRIGRAAGRVPGLDAERHP
jgi:hypothetical protein